MNRHHPYGGYDEPRRSPPLRSGGPDRGYRSERGGRGRGRGRGRGGGYGSYDDGPSDPYFNSYDDPRDDFGPDGYDDGPRRRPPPRRERDDRVHDTLIEERIQRERPCRTLFIRNIKYESNGDELRARFEQFGEIKTFFDLISSRGMVFVTFYDLRAAERARERLQGSDVSGRPIDVHYSLPRGDETDARCDRDKNQGTLEVTLRGSPSRQHIDQIEVRRKFAQFGDVKGVRPAGPGHNDQCLIEMYDIRATEAIYDRLHGTPLQDGTMELAWAWDIPETPLPPGSLPRRIDPPRPRDPRDFDDDYRDPPLRARGRGRGRGRGLYDNERDRDWDRDRDRDDFRDRRGSRFDDYDGPRGPPPPRGAERGGYDDRYRDEPYPYRGPRGPEPNGSAAAPTGAERERLEQAKRVQELLQALKQPVPGAAPPQRPPTAPAPPPPVAQPPYYGGGQQNGYPSAPQPPYPSYPPQPQQLQQPQQPAIPNAAALAGLPPSVLALLASSTAAQQQQQQQQQQQHQQQPPQQHQPQQFMPQQAMQSQLPPQMSAPQPMSNQYGALNMQMQNGGAAPSSQNPTMQQILAMLANQTKRT